MTVHRFFDVCGEILPTLKKRYLILFLDYDGTLTPIVERPELAKLSSATKKVLEGLAREEEIKVIIISGRSLSNLKKLVGVPNLLYVGNHGFELEGPKIHYIHPGALAAKQHLEDLEKQLKKAFRDMPEIQVENKGLTLSVHYRRAELKKAEKAETIFLNLASPYLSSAQLSFAEGKKVWELRPKTQWDKGAAVMWLIGRVLFRIKGRPLPIYIGDDTTDEDAFKALKHKGISIKVTENGKESSHADYYLRSSNEVTEFLKTLKKLKKNVRNPKILV